MFKRFFVSFFVLSCLSFNVFARAGDDPFAKSDTLNVGKDVTWKIDKDAGQAIKSSPDGKGAYYHLTFDNIQLKLNVSKDAAGVKPKSFSQFEITNIEIDGQQSPLFKWCLNNQERHHRFLQQGLTVKNDICVIDGSAGSFVMRLNKDTLVSLQAGGQLVITLKPYRTPLELTYNISDFKDMYLALNAKPAVVDAPVAATVPAAVSKPVKKCWANPPATYKKIKPVEYDCSDTVAKNDAQMSVTRLVEQEKEKEKKLAAEKEKQRKLEEEKKQKAIAAQLKQQEALQKEAAAIAASKEKQAMISDEIAQKMIGVCEKYWSKGEHRCYCQKYIDHAPAEIQASSTCK
jgi:hypothetical protein